jgi:hypothetical protein
MAAAHRPTASTPGPVCVVLSDGRSLPPAPLLGLLRRRGLRPRLVADAPAVMEALARTSVVAVMLIEPDRWPTGASLARAVRRHHPGVDVWHYHPPRDGAQAVLKRAPADAANATTPGQTAEPEPAQVAKVGPAPVAAAGSEAVAAELDADEALQARQPSVEGAAASDADTEPADEPARRGPGGKLRSLLVKLRQDPGPQVEVTAEELSALLDAGPTHARGEK